MELLPCLPQASSRSHLARRPAGCGFLPSPIIALRCGSFHPFDTLRQAGAAAVRVTGRSSGRDAAPHFGAIIVFSRGVPDLAQFAHGLGLFAVTRLVSRVCVSGVFNNWAWCLWAELFRPCLV